MSSFENDRFEEKEGNNASESSRGAEEVLVDSQSDMCIGLPITS